LETALNPALQSPSLDASQESNSTELLQNAAQKVFSQAPPTRARQEVSGAQIGFLKGVGNSGSILVECPAVAPGQALPARSTVPVAEQDIGRQVVLLFEQSDVGKPIIMGLLQEPTSSPTDNGPETIARNGTLTVEQNGERLVLSADREIVLRCGKASLTLTRAGKILIRGAYLLSRSSGVLRIKGGSVQIN
jgi:hypothetical protein